MKEPARAINKGFYFNRRFYFVIKNLVLWARSEFSGSAKRIAGRV
jgi:hypothetical protein